MGNNSGHPDLVCKKRLSRYLDDILNINNVHFDNMVSKKNPAGLQLSASFVDSFCYLCFVFVCHTVLSVPSISFGQGLERADIGSLICDIFLCFVNFPNGVLG